MILAKKPAVRGGGPRGSFSCVAAENTPTSISPPSQLQDRRAQWLARRFSLAPSMASVVASLAFREVAMTRATKSGFDADELREQFDSEQSFYKAYASGDRERALDLLDKHLIFYESEHRPHFFLYLISIADGPFFWRAIARHWTGFDRIPHRSFARFFKRHRATWSPEFLLPQDRAAYAILPEKPQVFRGQSNGPVGLSWTTNRATAEDFARGHRGIRVKEPVVVSATIRKADIAIVQTERKEDEVVIFSAQCARDREVKAFARLASREAWT
ncbi:MAG TPA: hypothetical protein VIF88_03940 [Methylocystis sp.]|jgi:hypothetical protein